MTGCFGKPCEMVDAGDIDMHIMPVIHLFPGGFLKDTSEHFLGTEHFVTASERLDSRIYLIQCLHKNGHRIPFHQKFPEELRSLRSPLLSELLSDCL